MNGATAQDKIVILLGALKGATAEDVDAAFFVSWILACLNDLCTIEDLRLAVKDQDGCALITVAQSTFHDSIHVQWQAMQLIGRLSATRSIADVFGFDAVSTIQSALEDCDEDSFGEFALTGKNNWRIGIGQTWQHDHCKSHFLFV